MTDDTRTRGKRGQDEATLDLFEPASGTPEKGPGSGRGGDGRADRAIASRPNADDRRGDDGARAGRRGVERNGLVKGAGTARPIAERVEGEDEAERGNHGQCAPPARLTPRSVVPWCERACVHVGRPG